MFVKKKELLRNTFQANTAYSREAVVAAKAHEDRSRPRQSVAVEARPREEVDSVPLLIISPISATRPYKQEQASPV